ncbi:peptidoglycan-recognition protein LB-like [Leptidea sinapis]|uniref:peptidoglycan-recognition protein LB-like n=1 Tax=Leptidea sinapis TaxID=189913 RepID=UPI002143C5EE|nr:peptidoglycan-recognition protein LB-like [Leptidea sinapis]
MKYAVILLCLAAFCESSPVSTSSKYDLTFVSREKWGALPPVSVIQLNSPVNFVIIHHSYLPAACFNFITCAAAMRSMQNFHQLTNQWADIGYNFAVGSDGAVYEGRGWDAVGAHAAGYNSQSIGIVLIGDWISSVPPSVQLQAAKDLISIGVELGYIRPDYQLIGHRQVRATECPGDALYNEISNWERFTHDVY